MNDSQPLVGTRVIEYQEVQRSFTDIIFGGVLERFPRLTLVSSENDSGWFPHYLYRLDHAYASLTRCPTSRCR